MTAWGAGGYREVPPIPSIPTGVATSAPENFVNVFQHLLFGRNLKETNDVLGAGHGKDRVNHDR